MKLPWNKLSQADPIAEFWNWFESQASTIDLNKPNHQQELGKRLTRIKEGLVWGCTVRSDAKPSTLEISADGLSALIPTVQAVVAAAPQIPGWEIVAFRQTSETFSATMNGNQISLDTVYWIELATSNGFVHIALYVPLSDDRARQQMGFIALDHGLGEYMVMTRIGKIDFLDYALAPANAKPLRELATYLSVSSAS